MDASFWKGKKVFVTGNSGFKGSWLGIWLAAMGAKVYGYHNGAPTEPSLFALASLKPLFIADYEGDICNQEVLNASINTVQPDIVIHMAAQPLVGLSYKDPVGTYTTNIMGTIAIMEAVRQCPSVKVLLNVTTDKVYKNQEKSEGYAIYDPLGGYDPYAASKACSELITDSYLVSFFGDRDIGIATARAGNVIGGGDYAADRLIPDILRSLDKGERVVLRNPLAIRPWQHVLDALSGYLLLCEKLWEKPKEYSKAWNFGPKWKDRMNVAGIVSALTGNEYDVSTDRTMHETQELWLDSTKTNRRLSWYPRWGICDALTKILQWEEVTKAKKNYLGMCQRQIEEYMATSLPADDINYVPGDLL
jgi:CDP-glucose 4,6-dehydratase